MPWKVWPAWSKLLGYLHVTLPASVLSVWGQSTPCTSLLLLCLLTSDPVPVLLARGLALQELSVSLGHHADLSSFLHFKQNHHKGYQWTFVTLARTPEAEIYRIFNSGSYFKRSNCSYWDVWNTLMSFVALWTSVTACRDINTKLLHQAKWTEEYMYSLHFSSKKQNYTKQVAIQDISALIQAVQQIYPRMNYSDIYCFVTDVQKSKQ